MSELNDSITNYGTIHLKDDYHSVKPVGIVGIGVVGTAMFKSFRLCGINCIYYDKYAAPFLNVYMSSLSSMCEQCSIIFLALPSPLTAHSQDGDIYDISSIHETLRFLEDHSYDGLVVLKSTLLPRTTFDLSLRYPSIHLIHNPEFLSAKTALQDFHNQTHTLIGLTNTCTEEDINMITTFYSSFYPEMDLYFYTSTETECIKLFCNSFYATKIQFMNELYAYTMKRDMNFDRIRDGMLRQGWIHPMHTNVPGHDGKISFGGACLPKDTEALYRDMERLGLPHQVIRAVCCERDDMRKAE